MGIFFGNWSGPQQKVVDPRKNIRLSWLWYQDPNNTENEDILQYFRLAWKPATIKGWTDPAVKSVILEAGAPGYTLPPYTFTLNSVWSWRIEAWVIDKDYDPDVTPGPGVPTGDPFISSQSTCMVDTSGYTMSNTKFDSSVASGQKNFGSMGQLAEIWTLVPSVPGEYEFRVRVSNGFQWSDWSTPVSIMQYRTRRWVKKAGTWNAVPEWKKTGGSMTEIRK